jgi:ABC-type transport system involved in multi-copper enzyme maturation permease subunit
MLSLPEGSVWNLPEILDSIVLPSSMATIFTVMQGVIPLFIIIMVASTVGTEYNWGTIRHYIARGTSRSNYINSKIITMIAIATIWILAVIVVGFITCIITTIHANGESGIGWDFLNIDFINNIFLYAARTLLIVVPYLLLTIFLITIFRSSTTPLIIGGFYFFIVPILIGQLSLNGGLSEIFQYSLTYNIEQLIAINPFYEHDFSFTYWLNLPAETQIQPWWHSTIILLGYCLIIMSALHYIFRNQT